MKILQIGKAYPPVNLGGVEVVIALLTEGLNKRGYYCDALGVNGSYKFCEEQGMFGGKVIRTKLLIKAFSTLFSFQMITQLKRIQSDYKVIHIHAPDPMAALALFLCRPSAKIVLHWHSDILKQQFLLFFFKPIQQWLLRRADLILTTSPSYLDGSEYLHSFRSKVDILPIGLDVTQKSFLGVPNGYDRYLHKKIIFSLGRLAYYKGYEYLILGAKELDENCVLIIAGEGNERERLQLLIKENNLDEKVVLLGKVSEVEKDWLFKNCSVFALSSIYKTEAYAIVQVEAMAYSKPIISTRIQGSGVDWVNLDGITGITVPVRNAKAIGIGINKLLNDNELYLKYSRNALQRYNKMFTQGKMIDELLIDYKKLLAKDDR